MKNYNETRTNDGTRRKHNGRKKIYRVGAWSIDGIDFEFGKRTLWHNESVQLASFENVRFVLVDSI